MSKNVTYTGIALIVIAGLFFLFHAFIQPLIIVRRSTSEAVQFRTITLTRPEVFGLREGDIIGAFGDVDIFIVNQYGFKRLFLNEKIFALYGHLRYENVLHVPASTRDTFFTSNIYRNCETQDERIWFMEQRTADVGVLHHVAMTGEQAVAQDPNFFKRVFCINSKEETLYIHSAYDYISLAQIPDYKPLIISTPTPTPRPSPTPTISPTPTTSPTGSTSPTPSSSISPTPTSSPGASRTPTPTSTPTPTPTRTPTPTPPLVKGPLRVLASNPRYFTNDGVNAVYLTGMYNSYEFQDNTFGDRVYITPSSYFSYAKQNNFTHLRLWINMSSNLGEGSTASAFPLPYLRTGPGTALDGQPKFNLDKFNPEFFSRLRDRVVTAKSNGIYVSIMLFNGWELENREFMDFITHGYLGHPYQQGNNINGLNGDATNGSMDSSPSSGVKSRQRAYVAKIIDTVNDLDNVLYEIINEGYAGSINWQYDMVNYIKSYERSKPKQHPVGADSGDNNPADYIFPGFYNMIPRYPASGDKVVFYDSDHTPRAINNLKDSTLAREWAWKVFTLGYNPIVLKNEHYGRGGYDVGDFATVGSVMGQTSRYASRANLATMTSQVSRCSTGYCLASNTEMIAYLPSGGSITVNATSMIGTLAVEWFNPRANRVTTASAVTGGTSSLVLRSPDTTGDWVLYLKKK